MINNYLLSIFFIIYSGLVHGQTNKYAGQIDVQGNFLEIELTITQKGDNYTGTIDIITQNAKGLSLDNFKQENDSLNFNMPEIPGGASARVKAKGDSLNGFFFQGPMAFKMNCIKRDDAPISFDKEGVSATIDSMLIKAKVAGVSIGVIYKDQIIMNDGFGFRDIDNKKEVDANTIFAIGSSSKAFTAALLAKSVEDDLISWDDPVRYSIPEFGMKDPFANDMTAVDLLTHRSGLPRHDMLWYGTDFTRKELVSKIRFLEGTEAFRTKFQYQNLMYLTAGYLAGKLNNTTWDDLLVKNIFEPLAMTNSSSSYKVLSTANNAALPYRTANGEISKMAYRNIDAVGPAGSINSTSTDMLKWLDMLLNGGKYDGDKSLLKSSSVRKMTSPQIVMSTRIRDSRFSEMTYGMGWMINYYNGHKIVKHGGNIDGFTALVYMMPQDDLGIVVLANANNTNLNEAIALTITDELLNIDDEDWLTFFYPNINKPASENEKKEEPKKSKKSKKDVKDGPYLTLEEYAGQYKHDVYGLIDLKFVKDHLEMNLNGFDYSIKHHDKEVFIARENTYDSDMKFSFHFDLAGTLDHLEIVLEASLPPMEFKKMAGSDLKKPSYLSQFIGKYDLNGMMMEAILDGNELSLKVTGQGTFALIPSSKNKFTVTGMKGYAIEFISSSKNKITGLIAHQPQGDFDAKKVD